MLDERISNIIITSSDEGFVGWLKDNQNLIYHYNDVIMNRCNTLNFDEFFNYDVAVGMLNALYIKKLDISENEFNILEAFTRNMFRNGFNMGDSQESPLYIYLIFLQSYDIVNKEDIDDRFVRRLYQAILDVYIPHDEPYSIINTLADNFKFKDIIKNANNTSWFTDAYKEKNINLESNLKELLLVFKYVSDIYSNRQQKLDFFFKLHRLYIGAYSYITHFNAIADRYEKFFKEDTRYIMINILDNICGHGDSNDFLLDWGHKYSSRANNQVMKCFINDISVLRQFVTNYSHDDKLDSFRNTVEKMWGSKEYDHEVLDEASVLLPDDRPISYIEELSNFNDIATEAVHKDSPKMNEASKKIYKAYKTYKSAEEKVDSQISKGISGIKKVLTGDVRTELIEGRKFSALGLLKKYLTTVAIFSYSKMAGVIAVVTSFALKKSTTKAEKEKIIMELETEIEIINEKIEDAKGDGNRKAKYAMMRTRKELENAKRRIEYGIDADTSKFKSVGNFIKDSVKSTAKSTAAKIIG